jgi:hypothetical protein
VSSSTAFGAVPVVMTNETQPEKMKCSSDSFYDIGSSLNETNETSLFNDPMKTSYNMQQA